MRYTDEYIKKHCELLSSYYGTLLYKDTWLSSEKIYCILVCYQDLRRAAYISVAMMEDVNIPWQDIVIEMALDVVIK